MKRSKQVLYLMYCALFGGGAAAQEASGTLDPAGHVRKYDVHFDGVGPRVYVLPAPHVRSRQELLAESYQAKADFETEIDRALDMQHLLSEFRHTANADYIHRFALSAPPNDPRWDAIVQWEIEHGNHAEAYAVQHVRAFRTLQTGATARGLELLLIALQQAQKTNNGADIEAIRHNLASVYLFRRDLKQADAFLEEVYASAVRRADLVGQGDAIVGRALIQAHAGDTDLAEDNVIHRAIPLFDKAKAHGRKATAWQTLAKIYRMQHKHPQAQWFLIQARDLAENHHLPAKFAEIEYMLGLSKFSQQNYSIAQREFIHAHQLAEGNNLLQLAIVDKLGQIYLADNDLDHAEQTLTEYQNLRSLLFPDRPMEAPSDR